jgi:hypothetical protein
MKQLPADVFGGEDGSGERQQNYDDGGRQSERRHVSSRLARLHDARL